MDFYDSLRLSHHTGRLVNLFEENEQKVLDKVWISLLSSCILRFGDLWWIFPEIGWLMHLTPAFLLFSLVFIISISEITDLSLTSTKLEECELTATFQHWELLWLSHWGTTITAQTSHICYWLAQTGSSSFVGDDMLIVDLFNPVLKDSPPGTMKSQFICSLSR